MVDDSVRVRRVARGRAQGGAAGDARAPPGRAHRRRGRDAAWPVSVSWHLVSYGPNPGSHAWNIGIGLAPASRGHGVGAVAQRLLAEWLLATTSTTGSRRRPTSTTSPSRRRSSRPASPARGCCARPRRRVDGRHDLLRLLAAARPTSDRSGRFALRGEPAGGDEQLRGDVGRHHQQPARGRSMPAASAPIMRSDTRNSTPPAPTTAETAQASVAIVIERGAVDGQRHAELAERRPEQRVQRAPEHDGARDHPPPAPQHRGGAEPTNPTE